MKILMWEFFLNTKILTACMIEYDSKSINEKI